MTKKEKIINLLNEGKSYNDISNEVGVSKSYISQIKKQMSNENKTHELETLEVPRNTTETNDIPEQFNIDNGNALETKKEVESINLRRSSVIYNIENPQIKQREESDQNLVLDLNTGGKIEEEEEETFEEVDEEMLKHEFLGIYESVNLFLDNFEFYQSKEIKKGKLDAIVKNFRAAYPGRHFMSSKILFFTLVISVFASNLKIDKLKKSKLFSKFRKNG